MQLFVADMGVPMIGIYWPPAWLALIPVITIEAWWARRVLAVGWGSALLSTTLANLVSTVVGIPLAWIFLAALELRFFGTASGLNNPAKCIYAVTLQAPWLTPYEGELWWMIPTAAVVLTGMFFLASVGIEWAVMRIVYRRAKAAKLRRWAWKGNLLSYGVILLFVFVFLYVPRRSLDHLSNRPVEFVMDAACRIARWVTPAHAVRRGEFPEVSIPPVSSTSPAFDN